MQLFIITKWLWGACKHNILNKMTASFIVFGFLIIWNVSKFGFINSVDPQTFFPHAFNLICLITKSLKAPQCAVHPAWQRLDIVW